MVCTRCHGHDRLREAQLEGAAPGSGAPAVAELPRRIAPPHPQASRCIQTQRVETTGDQINVRTRHSHQPRATQEVGTVSQLTKKIGTATPENTIGILEVLPVKPRNRPYIRPVSFDLDGHITFGRTPQQTIAVVAPSP